MRRIDLVRTALEQVPEALIDLPPESAGQGEQMGKARTLWVPGDSPTAPFEGMNSAPDDIEGTPAEEPGHLEDVLEFVPRVEEQDLVAGLGGKAGAEEKLRARLVKGGVDALAFYVSFHQRGAQWGIYLPVSGLLLTALGCFGELSCDLPTKTLLAFRMLHQHEVFHFAADYLSAQLELLTGEKCWANARVRIQHQGYNRLEEKLANAWMLRSLWRGKSQLRLKGRSAAVRKFVATQPEGYRDAPTVVSTPRFFPACEDLALDYFGMLETRRGDPDEVLRGMELLRLFPFEPYIDWRYCPVHLVHDEAHLGFPPFDIDLLRFGLIQESERFLKDLRKLDHSVARRWEATKNKLRENPFSKGLDFKQFYAGGQELRSVRVNQQYRAHLVPTTPPDGWEAVSIGTHKDMGHG